MEEYTVINVPPLGFESHAPYFFGIIRLDCGLHCTGMIAGQARREMRVKGELQNGIWVFRGDGGNTG